MVPEQPMEEIAAGNRDDNFRPESPSRWAWGAARRFFRGMTDGRLGRFVDRRSSGVGRRSCDGAAAELRSVLPTVLPEVPSKSKPLKMRPRISKIVAQPRAAPSNQSRKPHRPNIGQQCLALYLPSLKPRWQCAAREG